MEEYLYRKARKRVKKKKGFYAHLSVYISVGVFFLTMNLVTDPWDLWFFYPMMPWGIGLLIHYFGVFGLPGKERVMTEKWEAREMEREVRRLRRLEGFRETKKDDFLNLDELNRRPEKVQSKKSRWEEDDLV